MKIKYISIKCINKERHKPREKKKKTIVKGGGGTIFLHQVSFRTIVRK